MVFSDEYKKNNKPQAGFFLITLFMHQAHWKYTVCINKHRQKNLTTASREQTENLIIPKLVSRTTFALRQPFWEKILLQVFAPVY